jgi:hypothetical protein
MDDEGAVWRCRSAGEGGLDGRDWVVPVVAPRGRIAAMPCEARRGAVWALRLTCRLWGQAVGAGERVGQTGHKLPTLASRLLRPDPPTSTQSHQDPRRHAQRSAGVVLGPLGRAAQHSLQPARRPVLWAQAALVVVPGSSLDAGGAPGPVQLSISAAPFCARPRRRGARGLRGMLWALDAQGKAGPGRSQAQNQARRPRGKSASFRATSQLPAARTALTILPLRLGGDCGGGGTDRAARGPSGAAYCCDCRDA